MSSDLPTMTRDDLWLPGDCLGGAVLEGWQGPVWGRSADREWWGTRLYSGEHGGHMVAVGADRIEWWPESALHVYCNRPEVRDRLRRVLAAGKRCGACSGDGGWRSHASDGPVQFPGVCPACHGTGYTRPPHDLGHLIEAEIRGDITPVGAAGLWHCSVLRVEAGMGPVTGWDAALSLAHSRCVVDHWCGRHLWWTRDEDARDCFTSPSGGAPLGWAWGDDAGGLEVGSAAVARLHTAALSAGHALREPGALILPYPSGPRRLETP